MTLMVLPGAVTPPATANLIRNGSLIGTKGDWLVWTGGADTALTYTADESRSVGSGALSWVSGGPGAFAYRPSGSPDDLIPLGGLTTIDVVAWVRSDNAEIYVTPTVDFYGSNHGTQPILGTHTHEFGPLDASAWTEVARRDVAVPEGATHCSLRWVGESLSEALPVFFDDLYLGEPDGDLAPYPYLPPLPFPANRLFNGGFEEDLTTWQKEWGTETVTRDTAAPITGAYSLKVVTPGGDPNEGVGINSGVGKCAVIPGEPLRWSLAIKGSGTVLVKINGLNPYGPYTLTSVPQSLSEDFTVPDDSFPRFQTSVEVFTDGTQAITYWLDDVSLGTPQD